MSRYLTNGGGDMSIKQKRESKGLTQEDLGKMLNVNRTTVAMWESGSAMPRAEKLPKIAEVLECKIEELFG
jgi:putative transcriptional regulator